MLLAIGSTNTSLAWVGAAQEQHYKIQPAWMTSFAPIIQVKRDQRHSCCTKIRFDSNSLPCPKH
jgi:hypothetical protein